MEIMKGIKIVDLGLKIGKILIFADFHIGYEEALNKQGIFMPMFQFGDTIKRIIPILEKVKPEIIIINGDLKHEFGIISDTEWKQTLKLLELFQNHSKNVVLIKGNHDKILEPIAKKKGLEITDHYIVKDCYICHGDAIPKKVEQKTIIIGHEHPAITLRTEIRAERFKCFLLGRYKQKNLIVQPSFNLVTEGTDVLRERLLSPFLKQDLDNFMAFIVGDKVFDFGKLKKLRNL
ncbi:metallophosphoesterase [Candidatus Woesearchaeota archaeon]|nr:metallophosphoesterase [Candidatus Woesearchaeota archaeon]